LLDAKRVVFNGTHTLYMYIYIFHTAFENFLNFIGQSLGHKSLYKRLQTGNINAHAKGDNSHP